LKELILLTIISGLIFCTAIISLIFGFTRKSKILKLLSLFAFIAFGLVAVLTAYKFINKSYNIVAKTFKPRTGEEIYDALFGKREFNCVKVVNKQDQVIPKIDYAIWLRFSTCPEELNRILSQHNFTLEKLSTKNWNGKIPYGESLDWFNPAKLGDTIMVYEYSTSDNKSIQTIWTSLDSTEVFVRDILG
jgi:hypothetical protein